MKILKFLSFLIVLLPIAKIYAQQKTEPDKLKISGTVIEKVTKQKLEYATIKLTTGTSPKSIVGGITNAKGEFTIQTVAGTYDITIEFVSFKSLTIKNRLVNKSIDLGELALEEDATQLNEVVVRAESTSVEIKLDKKVYSIGSDLIVKGGTVSDVLNNVPSVAVDAEGTISLRGNTSVTILIDGKPSNAVNINEALRLISADAIDKVEVITNPSARYDAEGGAGILNIILKKGKNQGLNGTFIGSLGDPRNTSIGATLNYKTKKYNLFTNQGFSDRNAPGNGLTDTNYLNPRTGSPDFIAERRDTQRLSKSYNGNIGIEWYLTDSSTWTNSINYRNSNGNDFATVTFDNFFSANPLQNNRRTRINATSTASEDVEYKSSYLKKFKKEGHSLNLDVQISDNNEEELANIIDKTIDNTTVKQGRKRQLYQADYVLPLGKGGQYEAGYRGSFSNQLSDATVFDGGIINLRLTNNLEFIEKVNAFYSQYGQKINKFSYLLGLRWEDTTVDINTINSATPKRYNNFFPSAFLTYEISKESSFSVNYSRRIVRPRGRFINPFNNYSSNINIFQGNPDLDPAMTHSFDFGYLNKVGKFLLSSSVYANATKDAFVFARIESGDFVNGTPVIISSPINLANEWRAGFEVNANYSPYKWWKLNSNFNYFFVETAGDYIYKDFTGKQITQNFDNSATSWSARLNSKLTLPYKIDWQTTLNITGDEKTAQGKVFGITVLNVGLSKDVMKEKATLSFNVSDVFNTSKRITQVTIPNLIESYGELQFRQRQLTVSFTYRFNRKKTDREPRRETEDRGGEFQG